MGILGSQALFERDLRRRLEQRKIYSPENQEKLNDLTNKRQKTQEEMKVLSTQKIALGKAENLTPENIQKITNRYTALSEFMKMRERLDSLLEEFDGLGKKIDAIDFTLPSLKERLSEMKEPKRKTAIYQMSWQDLKNLAKEMSIRFPKKMERDQG